MKQTDLRESYWEHLQKKVAIAPKGTLTKRRRDLQKFTTQMLKQEMGK